MAIGPLKTVLEICWLGLQIGHFRHFLRFSAILDGENGENGEKWY